MKRPLISQHSGCFTPLKSDSAGPDGEAVETVGWGGEVFFLLTNCGLNVNHGENPNYEIDLNGLLDNKLILVKHIFWQNKHKFPLKDNQEMGFR